MPFVYVGNVAGWHSQFDTQSILRRRIPGILYLYAKYDNERLTVACFLRSGPSTTAHTSLMCLGEILEQLEAKITCNKHQKLPGFASKVAYLKEHQNEEQKLNNNKKRKVNEHEHSGYKRLKGTEDEVQNTKKIEGGPLATDALGLKHTKALAKILLDNAKEQ